MATVTETFTGTNGDLVPGWTPIDTGSSGDGFRIASNTARDDNGTLVTATNDTVGEIGPGDVDVRMQLTTLPSGGASYASLLIDVQNSARTGPSTGDDGSYFLARYHVGAGPGVQLAHWKSGTSDFTTYDTDTSWSWSAGHWLRLTRHGNTLRVYASTSGAAWTELMSQVATIWTDQSGWVGMGINETTPRIDNWKYTNTPEFVWVGDFRTFGTSATDVDADTPTGITAGDTIFFVLLINDAMKATVAYPGSVTQVGSWVTGVTDFVGTVPATGLFRATWDGVATDYAFTFDDVGDRGGGIATYGYTGDCTHRQTVTGTDPEGSASRNSPTLNGTSGNLVFAAMGGSANTTTNTWSGGFTERDDQENYGVNTGADAPSGASVTATLDPGAASTQSMWILEEIGPEGGFAPGSAAWVGTL